MSRKKTILIVDDERNIREVLQGLVETLDYESVTAQNGQEATEKLRAHPIHTVITDLKMPKMDGLALLEYIKGNYPTLPVIMITAHGTIDTAVEAMKKGAFDYITKPFDSASLAVTLKKAIQTDEFYTQEFSGTEEFRKQKVAAIGKSKAIREILDQIPDIAKSQNPVLLTGETGTGKELVARLIHEQGPRKKAPFIKINCAAIPRDAIEAELFGVPVSALNEYSSGKPGAFELAQKGTLFLDEIASLPEPAQLQLLGVLQKDEFRSIGDQPTKVSFRLLCATNLDLYSLVDQGKFLRELFYRLSRIFIYLPPLRERMGDIELLAQHFLEFAAREQNRKSLTEFSEDAMSVLIGYPWPGNIRELINVVESAVRVAKGKRIEAADLPQAVREDPRTYSNEPIRSLKELVEQRAREAEKAAILETLVKNRGDLAATSLVLGISLEELRQRVYAYNISLAAFQGRT